MRDFRRYTISFLMVGALFLGGMGFVGGWGFSQAASQSNQGYYEKMEILRNVLGYVRENYVDQEKLTPDKLIYGSIDGMLESLDDPYSRLMRPDEYRNMKTETDQEFGGLGIYIAIKNDQLTVIAPIEGTPAFEAGLMPGDVIQAIEGKSTEDIKKTSDAVKKLRGPKGSRVQLTILRDGETFKVTITRDEIPIRTVFHRMFSEQQKIGYLKITNFGKKTHHEVQDALKDLDSQGMEALILDLRSNPGGLLHSAYEVADLWIERGNIVYTKGRAPGSNKQYPANQSGTQKFYPMSVLVNKGSASGSEIVTGALKDHRRALVMGDTTFGKGLVQSVFRLKDGSALALTTARYFTPDGHMIQDQGIPPHLHVSQEFPSEAIQKEIMKLSQGDTVLNFVQDHKNPTDREVQDFIQTLRKQGFTLDDRYIRYRIRRQQLALEGHTIVADPSTDPQLRRALDRFRQTLDIRPWKVQRVAQRFGT